MILHIVLFTWKASVSREQLWALSLAMDELRASIPDMLSMHHGPDSGFRTGNADYVLSAVFPDEAAWRAYQDHPAHKSLIAEHVAPILERRTASQIHMKEAM